MSILELRDLIPKHGGFLFYDLYAFGSFYKSDIKLLALGLGSNLGKLLGSEVWT